MSDKVKVVIKSSRYHDVIPGAVGTIEGWFDDGFGVRLSGRWLDCAYNNGVMVNESRVMWYPRNEFSPCHKHIIHEAH